MPQRRRRLIGLVPPEINFEATSESPGDSCANEAGFVRLSRAGSTAERAEKYLKELRLWDKAFHQAREMSGGMKRRL
ncbi:ABC transporter OS=Rhodanobacter lindaniclasticus OX=75310 GN=B1991_05665 PE=4 SV=1 [Rhodanobacter lindaniclasticus]